VPPGPARVATFSGGLFCTPGGTPAPRLPALSISLRSACKSLSSGGRRSLGQQQTAYAPPWFAADGVNAAAAAAAANRESAPPGPSAPCAESGIARVCSSHTEGTAQSAAAMPHLHHAEPGLLQKCSPSQQSRDAGDINSLVSLPSDLQP
jgi:hypothetical protein